MEIRPSDLLDDSFEVCSETPNLKEMTKEDIYLLAKRTWNYGNYRLAQKYYKYITFIAPMDWEAPLFVALCNFHGNHNYLEFTNFLADSDQIYSATIDYILDLGLDNEELANEQNKLYIIIDNELTCWINFYYRWKDEIPDEYARNLQNSMFKLIKKYRDYRWSSEMEIKLTEVLVEFVKNNELKLSNIISDDEWYRLVQFVQLNRKLKHYPKKVDTVPPVTYSEKVGVIQAYKVYKYCDDENRITKTQSVVFVSGLLSIIALIMFFIGAILYKPILAILGILPLLVGVLGIYRGIMVKKGVRTSSILFGQRFTVYIDKNGDLQKDNKLNLWPLINIVLSTAGFLGFIFNFFLMAKSITDNSTPMVVISVSIFAFCLSLILLLFESFGLFNKLTFKKGESIYVCDYNLEFWKRQEKKKEISQ